MKEITKNIIVISLTVLVVVGIIKYLRGCMQIMRPAPQGIDGTYSLYYKRSVYKVQLSKDSLLKHLKKEGLKIKSGRLHDYDPPWDSLSYLISNVPCDNEMIEPYISFEKDTQNGVTTFDIFWINAKPNLSYDTTIYNNLVNKYFDCFEQILERNSVDTK